MRNHLPPILVSLVLLVLMGYWTFYELRWIDHQQKQSELQNSDMMAAFTQSILRTELRRGKRLLRDRLQMVFSDAMSQTPLVQLTLKDDKGKVLLQVMRTINAAAAQPLSSNIYTKTYDLKVSEDMMDTSQGMGMHMGHFGISMSNNRTSNEWIVLDTPKLQLEVKTDATHIHNNALRTRQRVYTTGLIGLLAILAFCVLWLVSLRQRMLRNSLELAQSQARHLKDLAQIASGLAHETKNPLGLIRGSAQQLLKNIKDNESQLETTSNILDQVDIATSRLGDFIAYAKPAEPDLAYIAVKALFERMYSLMRDEISNIGCTLKYVSPDIEINCDQKKLLQILMNLLLNAKQNSHSGCVINLNCGINNSTAFIEVNDNGDGISKEQLGDIFSPYTSRNEGGSGLGLAIVKRIVEAHGWNINVRSEPGVITTFKIEGIQYRTGSHE